MAGPEFLCGFRLYSVRLMGLTLGALLPLQTSIISKIPSPWSSAEMVKEGFQATKSKTRV